MVISVVRTGKGSNNCPSIPLIEGHEKVVGLGYMGLALSLQFARSGLLVLGLDTDAKKVQRLYQTHRLIGLRGAR